MQSTGSFLAEVRAGAAWAKVPAPLQVQVTRLFLEPATCPGCEFQPIPVDIQPVRPLVENGATLVATTATFKCPNCQWAYQIERKGTLGGALQRALAMGQRERPAKPSVMDPSPELEPTCAS